MITEKWHSKIQNAIKILQRHTNRNWYPPFIGVLAALDNLVLIVPTDGILISSSIITPKRWFILALCLAIGSTFGAMVLAALVELHGLPWILEIYPGISETQSWMLSQKFFDQYGLILVFAVAATPLVQQPTVILASLANTPLLQLAIVIFAGRFIKFLLMSYLGSHAPNLLGKLWGLKSELKEVGIKLKE
jgi:membrane protein YqaA with SNARE-associated domain